LGQEGKRVDGYQRQECSAKQLPTMGDSMNEEKIPECPEGHGEMLPAMGEVKKGEIRKIEQINKRCTSATQRAIQHRVFQVLMSIR
jgi:hypothetical protein